VEAEGDSILPTPDSAAASAVGGVVPGSPAEVAQVVAITFGILWLAVVAYNVYKRCKASASGLDPEG
jgi:hypothetical protein